ncbi:MAG: hypothetical protein WCW87_04110 [Candidatus Paceibacterota bacterium]
MRSYWFVYYAVYFIDKNNLSGKIKGNAVFEFYSEEFFPGDVIKVIEDFYLNLKEQEKTLLSGLNVVIQNFGEIEEKGFKNFIERNDSQKRVAGSCNFNIDGRFTNLPQAVIRL